MTDHLDNDKEVRKMPTKLLVDAYREAGSYREAARKLGVSVQFLHQRIKKHGGKEITTKEFVDYHAMSREELEKYIDQYTQSKLKAFAGEFEKAIGEDETTHGRHGSSPSLEQDNRNKIRAGLRKALKAIKGKAGIE